MARIDMTGVKVNRLTAIRFSHVHAKKRIAIWEFMCDCGKTHFARATDVRSGHVKSCGCLRLERLSEMIPYNFLDITGHRFGRLVGVKRIENKNKNLTRWLCLCDCGNYTEVNLGNLRNGGIQSCGCLNLEKIKERKTTHGMSKTRLYKVWSYIITRCYNEKCEHFDDYGGRGIKMSDEWRNDFMNFYNDMADGYMKGVQLDRIDVNGNYEKGNCRWVTAKENARNKRNTVYITHEGITKPLAQWAEEKGIKFSQLFHDRVKKGWKSHYVLNGKPVFDSSKMIIKG